MKSYRLFFSVFLMLSAVFLFSCEDEPLDVGLDDGLPNLEMGTITFKIDGVNKEFIGAATHRDHEFEDMGMKGWQITSTSLDGSESLGIQLFPAELEPGNYDLGTDVFEWTYVVSYMRMINAETMEFESYDSISGNVSVTDIDLENETMSGTFRATLVDFDTEEITIEITNGRISNIPLVVVDDSDFGF